MRGICSSDSRHIGFVSAARRDREAGPLGRRRAAAGAELDAALGEVIQVAIRSATRAGWFTAAVMLTIAWPTWIRFVRAATQERKTSGAGWCE